MAKISANGKVLAEYEARRSYSDGREYTQVFRLMESGWVLTNTRSSGRLIGAWSRGFGGKKPRDVVEFEDSMRILRAVRVK